MWQRYQSFVLSFVRIAIVCYPTVGGSGVVATELAKALACRGHEVHLVSYERPVRAIHCHPNLHLHQVEPPAYPLFRYLPYESALAGRLVALAESGVEIIHAHYAIPHAVSALLASRYVGLNGQRLPFVTTLHGTDTTLAREAPDLWPIIRLALHKSDVVTAVSHALARTTQEAFTLPEPPLVIPNFVDTQVFASRPMPELRALYAHPQEYILVHASNFRPVKQVPWLIQLFHRVRQAGLPAKLLLMGDGPERPNVEKLVREIGLERAVIFTGIVTEVQEYLSLGDVFLLSSREESFGLAVLEAMACGVPVLAPRTGGLPEVVQEGGLLYEPGDLDAAEKALFQILRDLPTYRQAARQNALRFDIHRIVPLYEKLYQTILTKASILS